MRSSRGSRDQCQGPNGVEEQPPSPGRRRRQLWRPRPRRLYKACRHCAAFRAPLYFWLEHTHASALTQLRTCMFPPTGLGRRTVPTGLAPCVSPPDLAAKRRFAFRQWCKTTHNLLQGCGWFGSSECGLLALLSALASLGPPSLELLPSSGGGSLHLTRLQRSICALCLNGTTGDLLPRTQVISRKF